MIHLKSQGVPDRLEGQRIGRAIDDDVIAGDEQRREKRQPMDVVPVGVGDENGAVRRRLTSQLQAQRANARAGIQYDPASRAGPDSYARRIAAVPKGLRSWRRNRSPRTPKRNLHAVSHLDKNTRLLQVFIQMRQGGDHFIQVTREALPHQVGNRLNAELA